MATRGAGVAPLPFPPLLGLLWAPEAMDSKDAPKVTSPSTGESFTTAIERLDRALNRLDTSVRSLTGRLRSSSQLQADSQRLAGELDRATARADKLDEAAEIVSKRIEEAMTSVRSVLEEGDARG
ncbi:protein of unknown function [Pelagibacterium halotolerans]|nr:protein of unknown function [Pelagibacterium halotolerans]